MGQRSLPSSFLFRSSNHSGDFKDDATKGVGKKDLCVSLSDFLDKKLQKTCLLPKTVQEKQMLFSSVVNSGSGSIFGKIDVPKERETKEKCVLEEAVFKQFTYDKKEKLVCLDSYSTAGKFKSFDVDGMLVPRKRKYPFEGGNEKPAIPKHVVVLGADPKPKPKRREEAFSSNKKQNPIYNHYANGSGWWDGDMVGLDSKVRTSETWEGVGSTTLGGLDWS